MASGSAERHRGPVNDSCRQLYQQLKTGNRRDVLPPARVPSPTAAAVSGFVRRDETATQRNFICVICHEERNGRSETVPGDIPSANGDERTKWLPAAK